MKKITFLTLAFIAGLTFQVQAQEITLTQNTDENFVPGGVSCNGGDNQWYRAYDLPAEGVVYPNVLLVGMELSLETTTFDEDVIINLYDFPGFPTGFDSANPPVPIATETVSIGVADIGVVRRVDFTTPAIVPLASTIVVEINQPTVSGNATFLGVTAAETQFSYITSVQCALVGEPLDMDGVGFPDAHHFINLIVDSFLAVGDNFADLVNIYPNPATTRINIDVPANVEILSVDLYDIVGKNTGATLVNGSIDVSNLARGVYILNVKSDQGTLTQKVIKR